jgi:hypothetical protein
VQAGADSDLAASKYIGPTVYSMFGWSHNNKLEMNRNPQSLAKLRLLYHDVECFVINEVNALAAHQLAMIDEVMESYFVTETHIIKFYMNLSVGRPSCF